MKVIDKLSLIEAALYNVKIQLRFQMILSRLTLSCSHWGIPTRKLQPRCRIRFVTICWLHSIGRLFDYRLTGLCSSVTICWLHSIGRLFDYRLRGLCSSVTICWLHSLGRLFDYRLAALCCSVTISAGCTHLDFCLIIWLQICVVQWLYLLVAFTWWLVWLFGWQVCVVQWLNIWWLHALGRLFYYRLISLCSSMTISTGWTHLGVCFIIGW